MNNLKKRSLGALLLCLVLLAGCVTACGKANPKYSLKKIGNYLYETTISTDYDWNVDMSLGTPGAACSAIQMGQYRGRNYDWNYDDTDLCVIHTTVTKERKHASVGVADLGFALTEKGEINYAKLPFVTVDGINDAGVCIQVNVMPYGENGELSHTPDKSDDLDGSMVVRFVLDNADSVDGALELMKSRDIYSGLQGMEEMHWMISGPASAKDKTRKTVVAEVFPDGLHVTENFVNDVPIMTNFNISNFDGSPESVGWGMGYERWQILCENAAQADSVMGTFDLMEKVFYSKLYDLYGERFWYSEYAMTDLAKYCSAADLKAALGEETYAAMMAEGGVFYVPALWDGEKVIGGDISKTGILAPVVKAATESYKAQNMGTSLWITVETGVYDLENLTLDLQVRESQDHYHFTIE